MSPDAIGDRFKSVPRQSKIEEFDGIFPRQLGFDI